MTWKDLKNAVLGLMFSNILGNRKVELTASSVQEYVLNMPDAANAAFADMATVCPMVEEQEFVLPIHEKTISLQAIFPRFLKLLRSECFLTQGEGTEPFDAFYLHGADKLTFTTDKTEGTVTLAAACIPLLVTAETDENTEIPFPQKAITAISYYMAHRLYLEDEISIAMQYLNFYYALKAELSEEYSRAGYGKTEITNKAGWL